MTAQPDVLERIHRLVAVFPQAGQIRAVCSCGHKSSGFDRRSARDKHDAHAAEKEAV